MKITIITASYNSSKTIDDTLKSVAGQSYSNIEHIIVDGASKDETLGIVKNYPHVSQIVSEPDKGIYDAMNKGLQLATGDIIGILNSDDMLNDKDTLEDIVDMFKTNANIEAVYGNLTYMNIDMAKKVRLWISSPFRKNFIYAAWQPPHPTFYARKTTYDRVGNFNLKYTIGSDFDWLYRAFYVKKIQSYYLNRNIVKMREGGASNGSFKIRMTLFKDYYNTYKENNNTLIAPFAITLRVLSRIPQFFKK